MAERIHSKGPFEQEEINAAGAGIYPGMLLTLGAIGVVVHATEGGRAEALIACEDQLQGKTIATVYTISTLVTCLLPRKGCEVRVLIEDGQNVAIGSELISAGNGKFKVSSDLESGETLSQVLFIATEACDLTGSNTDDTVCRARAV